MYKKEIKDLVNKHHTNGGNCNGCNSNCCNESGFALLENVKEIYKFYKNGNLKRNDIQFATGMNEHNFIASFFDHITLNNHKLDIFFPKHLNYDNKIIDIPHPGGNTDYYLYRSSIIKNRKNRSAGCIFLKDKLSLSHSNECLLHDPKDKFSKLKPIDCVFLICDSNNKVLKPSTVIEQDYFSLLGVEFGGV